MLNVSQNNSISDRVRTDLYKSFSMVKDYHVGRIFLRLILISFILFLVILFLPWTQFVRSQGNVTVLLPENRPQHIQAVIGGRIEQWFVREGELVEKGDTILRISEIKDQYFDPDLLGRTLEQIDAKANSVNTYQNKVVALEQQIKALEANRILKINQAENYMRQTQLQINSDSIALEAKIVDLNIANRQLKRMDTLYQQGIKSLRDVESARMKYQKALADKISQENKLLESKNKLINATMDLNGIDNEYQDKLAKARADKFATQSEKFNADAEVAKMKNQYSNYAIRNGLYYITAPQSGYVTKAVRTGIGETVKEGESLMSIVPKEFQLAVEMFVYPADLPLLARGQEVRFIFDGWPSVVFSGWPNLSYGTFGGEIVAIDNLISQNGYYRVLVAPKDSEEPWPDQLKVGSGAVGIALLKEVPVWYEIWRKLNGFPPDYYKPAQANGFIGIESLNKSESSKKSGI